MLRKYQTLIRNLTGPQHEALCAVHEAGKKAGRTRNEAPTLVDILNMHNSVLGPHQKQLIGQSKRFQQAAIDIYVAGRNAETR